MMAVDVLITAVCMLACHNVFVLSDTSGEMGSSELTLDGYMENNLMDTDMRSVVVRGPVTTEVLRRAVRSVRSQPGTTDLPVMSNVVLNDTHLRLFINWVGAGSRTVVVLTRDIGPVIAQNSTSCVYVSYDDGKAFVEVQHNLMRFSYSASLIHLFYKSPASMHYLCFVDRQHRCLFTTTDTARTFSRHWLSFGPRQLFMSPSDRNVIVALSSDKKLWLSLNFGNSWRILKANVEKFSWGFAPFDVPDTVYVQLAVMRGHRGSSLQHTSNFFNSTTQIFDNVVRFLVKDAYICVLVEPTGGNHTNRQLWVSYRREMFRKAQFPDSKRTHQNYVIADASEGQLFVGVTDDSNVTDLYISEVYGHRFSLSLEDLVATRILVWPSEESRWFLDFHKVSGLRGVFIVSQHQPGQQYRSLITYNKGARWRRVVPPTVDSVGHHTLCARAGRAWHHRTENCSLHLTQRYHENLDRSSAIVSSSSAIGLIIASGCLGSGLGARLFLPVNVYVSRNGGFTWSEVLKGSHFFEMLDHGGLIVAVKQRSPTKELLYSLNEGETWSTYQFSDVKVHVIGILTEPGSKTTMVTVFGAEPSNKTWSWTIKTIDLKPVFRNRTCGPKDYRVWSPTDNPLGECLLGRKTTIKRRRTNTNCYNGLDYEPQLSNTSCRCRRDDYECDYDYKEINGTNMCALEPGVTLPDFSRLCTEFSTYNRTKGYRRIAGDMCHGGYNFLEPERIACPARVRNETFVVYSTRNSIIRYFFESRRVHHLPIAHLRDVTAVDYDYLRNCVYWADTGTNKIQRLCLDGNSTVETLVTESTSHIEGLAYDWMGGALYWLDTMHLRLEMSRSDGSHRRVIIHRHANGTHVFTLPRALVVAPAFGRLFWSDWSPTRPRIMTAWLDGTHIEFVVNDRRRAFWPNGLAIDYEHRRLYWTDAHLHSISYCSFNGAGYRVVISGARHLQHPYAIALYRDDVFWSDWGRGLILRTNKYTGRAVSQVTSSPTQLLDIKLFYAASQQGLSECSAAHVCASLCVETPPQTLAHSGKTVRHACLCSDAFSVKHRQPGGSEVCDCNATTEVTRPQGCFARAGEHCSHSEFGCASGQCILSSWRCDHDYDCRDRSDELDCVYVNCSEAQFECGDGHCIPGTWKCDGDQDCPNGSDEPPSCSAVTGRVCPISHSACDDGQCIPTMWFCDGDDDCFDGSDEANCNDTTSVPTGPGCRADQFACLDRPGCVQRAYVCDGDYDCVDGTDELHCNATSRPCPSSRFSCADGIGCIPRRYLCDGDRDCNDGSDERHCTSTVTTPQWTTRHECDSPSVFHCANHRCVSLSEMCNGLDDCGDNSDEDQCHHCSSSAYRCASGQCIVGRLRCDGHHDCRDGSDEIFCSYETTPAVPCGPEMYRCSSRRCIYKSALCNGVKDCENGDDETNCEGGVMSCDDPAHFECLFSRGCIAAHRVCDGKRDCEDNSDESDCNGEAATSSCHVSELLCGDGHCISSSQVCDDEVDCRDGSDETTPNCDHRELLFFYVEDVGVNWIRVVWRFNPRTNVEPDDVIAMHRRTGTVDWLNKTTEKQAKSQKLHHFTFLALRPKTSYELTFSAQKGRVMPVKTISTPLPGPFLPSELHTVMREENGEFYMLVQWTRPQKGHADIKQYIVYYTDMNATTKVEHTERTQQTATYLRLLKLTSGHTYSIAVAAVGAGVWPRSAPRHAAYADRQPICVHAAVSSLAVSVTATWETVASRAVPAGVVSFRLVAASAETLDVKTLRVAYHQTQTVYKATVDHLLPGVKYTVTVETMVRGGVTHDTCPGSAMSITTVGRAASKPFISSIDQQGSGNVLRVTWHGAEKNARFRVYYSDNSRQLVVSDYKLGAAYVTSTTLETTLTGLLSCEDYFVRVQQVEPTVGRLSDIRSERTDRDRDSPPKHVRVDELHVSHAHSDLMVIWDAACDYDVMARTYMIVIKVEGKDHGVITELTRKTRGISHLVKHLKRGATYSITVHEYRPRARDSAPVVRIVAPFPAPEEFRAFHHPDNTVFLTWKRPPMIDSSILLVYEIEQSVRPAIGSATSPVFSAKSRLAVSTNQYLYKHLKGKVDYVFRVRIASIYGYPGNFTRPVSIFVDDSVDAAPQTGAPGGGGRTALWVGVSAGLTVAVLLVALFIYAVRHRRLQRSFTDFASREYTQYDARSGVASLGSVDELAGDDQPLICGFSGDEPLIVA